MDIPSGIDIHSLLLHMSQSKQWIYPLKMVDLSILMLVYQRVPIALYSMVAAAVDCHAMSPAACRLPHRGSLCLVDQARNDARYRITCLA